MIIGRVVAVENLGGVFLIWNLFLAWIPLGLAYLLELSPGGYVAAAIYWKTGSHCRGECVVIVFSKCPLFNYRFDAFKICS